MTPLSLDRPAPLPQELLRAEVAALRRREHRRIFPARLCVGPGSDRWAAHELAWPPRDPPDDGLLFDVLDALRDAVPGSGRRRTWLLRPGAPELHDLDVRVAAVADRVAAAHGTPATEGLVVVTRYGWLDARTGESRGGSASGSRPAGGGARTPRCGPGRCRASAPGSRSAPGG